jgi:hypothetical protein
MNQKLYQQIFLKYLYLLHTIKKLRQVHLVRLGFGSGPRRPDPTGSGYATLPDSSAVNDTSAAVRSKSVVLN